MSVSFWPADSCGKPLRSCDCHARYSKANERWWQNGGPKGTQEEPNPFDYECNQCQLGSGSINLNNRNARDLCNWLSLDVEYGSIKASELAARCRRRLWDESRNHDGALTGGTYQNAGQCKVIEGGREAGYLRNRTQQLLELAEKTGDGVIAWG